MNSKTIPEQPDSVRELVPGVSREDNVVWLRSRNLSPDATGSIHDEERARALGFKAALVGASVHSAFLTKLAVERFGKDWYERGFVEQTYIRPLYEDENFQIIVRELEPEESEEQRLELALETEAGVRITAGFFGLSRVADWAFWQDAAQFQEQERSSLTQGAVHSRTITRAISPALTASRRAVAEDPCSWYDGPSPWGGPIVPSFMYMLLGSSLRTAFVSGANRHAPMNSRWQLAQFAPMLADAPHDITAQIIDEGRDRRTAFHTLALTVRRPDGQLVAMTRQKMRWFAE